MAVLQSCCCCDLLVGSIVAAIYSVVVYLLAFCLSLWWLLDEAMYRTVAGGGRIPGYVLCAGHLLLVAASVLMLYGLYRRLERIVIGWVVLMVLVFFPEMGLVLFVNLYHRTVTTSAGMVDLAFYIARAALNVVCILCVHSLYSTWRKMGTSSCPPGLRVPRVMPPYSTHLTPSQYKNGGVDVDSLYNESVYSNGYYNNKTPSVYSHNGVHHQQQMMTSPYEYDNYGGFAAASELTPTKMATVSSHLDYKSHSLPRSSSRLSVRSESVYSINQRLPSQFNAALYASNASLNGRMPPMLLHTPMRYPPQYYAPYPTAVSQLAMYPADYALQGYQTQSLDRRSFRREMDCDALSLRGVGMRGRGKGFILTPRARGRGSRNSVGAESDDVKRFRDVAL